jgi:hypothetical protein
MTADRKIIAQERGEVSRAAAWAPVLAPVKDFGQLFDDVVGVRPVAAIVFALGCKVAKHVFDEIDSAIEKGCRSPVFGRGAVAAAALIGLELALERIVDPFFKRKTSLARGRTHGSPQIAFPQPC